MKPRVLVIIGAIFFGSLALQMLLARKAQSAPQAKAKIALQTKRAASKSKAKAKVAPKAKSPKIGVAKAIATPVALAVAPKSSMPIYDFKLETLDGKPVDLAKYQGKTLLIVNTASKCGYTKQYAGLQALSQKYRAQGLEVLGFPANNFGGQEPGSNAEIGEFCQKNYGVSFDMFSKVSVKGEDQAPLFKYLTTEANPDMTGEIGWNFEKFLVSRDGQLVARYKSGVAPDAAELTQAVESQLAKK